jgi:hypothetical protein
MGPPKYHDIFQQEHLKADQNPTVRKPKKKNGTKYQRKWAPPWKYRTENQILGILLLQYSDSQLLFYRTQAAFFNP